MKFGQPRHQPLQRERRQAAHLQRRVGRAQLPQRAAERCECRHGGFVQRAALRRQREPARVAHEQQIAEARLELADLLADRALRQVQRVGRLREAAEPARRFEAAQRAEQRRIELDIH